MQHTAPQVKLSPLMMEGHVSRGTVVKVPMMEHLEQKEHIKQQIEEKKAIKEKERQNK